MEIICYLIREKRLRYRMENDFNAMFSFIDKIDFDFKGKAVLDYGCKTGNYVPVFQTKGIAKFIGIDVFAEYIEKAKKKYSDLNDVNVLFMSTQKDGLINLQSESIDFIFMNEVISHINYYLLPVIFLECYRLLKKGGILFISDGNKINRKNYRETFRNYYHQWENGPDGIFTGRDTVSVCFINNRKMIIKKYFPELEEDKIDYLAETTSLLNEEQIVTSVKSYLQNDEYIERYYLSGICPVNPLGDGFLMERGFYTEYLRYALKQLGFKVKTPCNLYTFRNLTVRKLLKNILVIIWGVFFNKKNLVVYARKSN